MEHRFGPSTLVYVSQENSYHMGTKNIRSAGGGYDAPLKYISSHSSALRIRL